MQKINLIQSTTIERIKKPLLICGPLTTLAISPTVNFDPINLIKSLIFVTISFYCFGILIGNTKENIKFFSKTYRLIIFTFILFLTLPLLITDAPFEQQFWGNFGRNTGFVAYLSFLFLTISSSFIRDRKFYRDLVLALVLTTLPMTLYCFIQIAKLDPFNWSTFDIFGTLGNANFLSAFLGMGAIASIVFALDKTLTTINRLLLVLLSLISFGITIRTNSIQGPLIYLAGVGIALFFLIRSSKKLCKLRYLYLLAGFTSFGLGVTALFNKGPLAKIIFQPSVLYRADYMHAGWEMTKTHPWTGIGLDSFGDWYRQTRGVISTMRTGPERTSNTAHNIFLDISSGGGIFLLLSYLALLIFGLIRALKYFKGNSKFDPIFVAIFSIWCAYQIQSAISINQVGVGVWGWLFTGALIGYPKLVAEEKIFSNEARVKSKKIRRKKANLNASAGATSLVMSILGFSLAFIPWSADHRYYTAYNSRDLNAMIDAVKVTGSTSWHVSQVIEAAMKNNFVPQATEMDTYLLKKNPRDFFAWRVRYYLNTSTPEQKSEAISKMRFLDPFNPDIPKS